MMNSSKKFARRLRIEGDLKEETCHQGEDPMWTEPIQTVECVLFRFEPLSAIRVEGLCGGDNRLVSHRITLKLTAGHAAAETMAKRPSPPSLRTLNSHILRPPTSQ